MMVHDPMSANSTVQAAGGYGPPGGGFPPGGGGYGGPPGGAPPGGGGFGGPPGGGYGGPPGGPPPGGYGGPPGGGYGGAPPPGGYGAPPPQGFGPPGGGFPPPGGPMMPGAGGDVNTTLPLILSIVQLLFCCGFGTIFGVVSLVFSIQAGNAKKTGDLETARAKAKSAIIVSCIGFGLSIVGGIIYGVMGALNN